MESQRLKGRDDEMESQRVTGWNDEMELPRLAGRDDEWSHRDSRVGMTNGVTETHG
jgi:hypothetical protein